MTKERVLTIEDLEKVKIVLGDALPYELAMLEWAARCMADDGFRDLNNFMRNATIEIFWTHARCLIEFFNRTKNDNYEASSASARDFTRDDYYPSPDMEKLGEKYKRCGTPISTRINEQISHVGFCRKTEGWDKLGLAEMRYVKPVIDKETERFVVNLRPDFAAHWRGPRLEARFLHVQDQAVCTTNDIITELFVIVRGG